MVGMSKAKSEPRALPKRFYKAVAVQHEGAAFSITLDGKPIRTPAKKMLQVNVQQLAEAIAAEWRAQTEVIRSDEMPLTRLASIAIDRIALDREALLQEMKGYAETDLVCYRAEGILRARQAQHFDPLLDWANEQYGMKFTMTDGIMPITQPPHTLEAMAAQFAQATYAELAALAMLLPILGSAVLVLTVWRGRISIEEALVVARLDEQLHIEAWGDDAESRIAWANKCRDARACAFFLQHAA